MKLLFSSRNLALASALVAIAGWTREAAADSSNEPEPWLKGRLEWFQDLKFGLMMHWGTYCQWGCIESWPLVEEDTWARGDDLKAYAAGFDGYITKPIDTPSFKLQVREFLDRNSRTA